MKQKLRTARAIKAEPPTPPSEEAWVRSRAYELFEQQGREHGRDVEHWLQAEREFAAVQSQRGTS